MVFDTERTKMKAQLIDLHTHTTGSDGEQSPEKVISCAKEAGLSAVAITDHNVFTYSQPFVYEGMLVIPGIEFSARYYVSTRNECSDESSNEYAEIHVVGIFPDGVDPADFNEILAGVNDGKEAYIEAILADLETRNIHITMDEVKAAKRECKHIGRQEIAKVLVEKGIEKNIESAFDHQIGNFSRYYIPSTKYINFASLKEIIHQIIESGGIPILAHPYGYSMGEKEMEQLIEEFCWLVKNECSLLYGSNGTLLAGMEVYYQRYLDNPERMSFLRSMQKKYGLLASAGGDRHREGQPFCTGGNFELLETMMATIRAEAERRKW